MKLIVELTSKSLIKKYLKLSNVKYLLVSYIGLSFNSFVKFTTSELKEIYDCVKNTNLSLILNCEKLFSDKELDEVKELINSRFFDMFEYVTYSDFGFKNLLEEEKVNVKFIFKAQTYLANHYDVNMYNELNDYCVASSEISSKELIELTNNVSKNIIIDLFGKSAIFYSRRKLLTNYFIHRNISNDASKLKYHVVEELRNDNLPIVENEIGSLILEPKYHMIDKELEKMNNVDYGMIFLADMKQKEALEVVSAYNKFIDDLNVETLLESFDNCNIPYYKGAYNIQSVLLKGGCSNE